jgi:hypothetical protein
VGKVQRYPIDGVHGENELRESVRKRIIQPSLNRLLQRREAIRLTMLN